MITGVLSVIMPSLFQDPNPSTVVVCRDIRGTLYGVYDCMETAKAMEGGTWTLKPGFTDVWVCEECEMQLVKITAMPK